MMYIYVEREREREKERNVIVAKYKLSDVFGSGEIVRPVYLVGIFSLSTNGQWPYYYEFIMFISFLHE